MGASRQTHRRPHVTAEQVAGGHEGTAVRDVGNQGAVTRVSHPDAGPSVQLMPHASVPLQDRDTWGQTPPAPAPVYVTG